ncbi:mechanosensitive ion channel family protein [Acidihalobacter prosperus]
MNPLFTQNTFDWHKLIQSYAVPWGIKILATIAILVFGFWLTGLATRLIGKALTKAKMDEMLVRFLDSIIRVLLQAIVVITALGQLGVKTTSMIAILGAAGLAIGFSLQNSLSNFAAGVLLLIFKPFKSGDFVEVSGIMGVVEQIHIFNSILRSPDNREVIVPNSKIYNNVITNFSARETRRIDLVIGISYDADIRQAKSIIENLMAEDARVLKDPAASCGVMELADSSINLFIRPWVSSADYWSTRCDMLEAIKSQFDANGIGIPFPQMDVHIQPGEKSST